MATTDQDFGEMVQLATRVPKSLHERLRVFCVERGMLVQDFVADAIAEGMHANIRTERTRTPASARRANRSPGRPDRASVDWRSQFGHIALIPIASGACPLCGHRSSIRKDISDADCEHDVGWLVEPDALDGTPPDKQDMP